MQGLNATLIVQAINFGIAYVIVRKLVFMPGVALVFKERDYESRLKNEVLQAADYVEAEKKRLTVEWLVKQKKLATNIPSLPEELFVLRHNKPSVSPEKLLDDCDVNETKKVLAQSLVYSVKAKQ